MWFIMGKYNGLSCLYIIIMVYNGIQIWFHDDIEHSTCVRITWCKILPIWIVIINYYVLLQTWGIPKSPRVYSILKWSSMTWMIWGKFPILGNFHIDMTHMWIASVSWPTFHFLWSKPLVRDCADREKKQETHKSPINLIGQTDGFRFRLSLKPIHWLVVYTIRTQLVHFKIHDGIITYRYL
jgi:hypothetical protein